METINVIATNPITVVVASVLGLLIGVLLTSMIIKYAFPPIALVEDQERKARRAEINRLLVEMGGEAITYWKESTK